MPLKIIFIHGNGGATSSDIWIPSVSQLLESANTQIIAETFPDNFTAKSSSWLDNLTRLQSDENTILVGHSSGALAAMRYAENNRIFGSVLVGAAHTDLGDPGEKASGYFETAWQWQKIRNNQNWIIQFGSTDDPYIPIDEQYFVRDNLATEFHEYKDRGHFMDKSFPELAKVILEKIKL